MQMTKQDKEQVSLRLDPHLVARVKDLIKKAHPYAPTFTQMAERGLEKACDELEVLQGKKRGNG